MTSQSPRVRFAPSPTGELHLGGARTALFNWLYARHHGGQFLLRIEDTDRKRSRPEFSDQIHDSLRWLGLNWDGPVLFQSQRGERYQDAVKTLLSRGRAYRCFCTREGSPSASRRTRRLADQGQPITDGELKTEYRYPGTCRNLSPEEVKSHLNQGQSYAVRLKIPAGKTTYQDLIYGSITVEHAELDDFILARSDGAPTYNLVVVIDDHDMGITHVIRGADHISNTPKQLLVYAALGFTVPQFAHLPLILGADKKRLSKRHGAPGIQHFREQGYLPQALINYLVLLGWNPDTEEEIFSVPALVQHFDITQVQKKAAVFDLKKLNWISGQHLMRSSPQTILEAIRETVPDWQSGYEEGYLLGVVEMLQVRSKSISELLASSDYFFVDPVHYDARAAARNWPDESVNQLLETFTRELAQVGDWSAKRLEGLLRRLARQAGVGAAKLIHPMRLALSGLAAGPSLFALMALLGRETCLRRIKKALQHLPPSSAEFESHD